MKSYRLAGRQSAIAGELSSSGEEFDRSALFDRGVNVDAAPWSGNVPIDSVSLAAGNLQRKKLIRYTPSAVTIINRKKLEDAACECYGFMHDYAERLGSR